MINDPSGRRAQVRAAAIVIALCFAAGVALALTSRRSHQPGKNEYRLEITSRTQINDSEGGTIVLSATTRKNRSVPVKIYTGGSDSYISGQLMGNPAMMTIQITPKADGRRTRTEISLASVQQGRTGGWFGEMRQDILLRSSAATTLGDSVFHWKVEPGVYPRDQPLLLGTADDQNVTLIVGDTAQ